MKGPLGEGEIDRTKDFAGELANKLKEATGLIFLIILFKLNLALTYVSGAIRER